MYNILRLSNISHLNNPILLKFPLILNPNEKISFLDENVKMVRLKSE